MLQLQIKINKNNCVHWNTPGRGTYIMLHIFTWNVTISYILKHRSRKIFHNYMTFWPCFYCIWFDWLCCSQGHRGTNLLTNCQFVCFLSTVTSGGWGRTHLCPLRTLHSSQYPTDSNNKKLFSANLWEERVKVKNIFSNVQFLEWLEFI